MRFVEVIAQVPPVAPAQIEEGGTEVPEIGLFLSLDFLAVGGYVEVSHMGTGIRGGDYVEDVFRSRPVASFFGSELSICDLALSDPDSPDGSQMVKVTLSSRHGGEIIAPPRFSTSHSAAGPHIEIVGSLANLTSELGGCVKYRHPALFVGTDELTIALNDLEMGLFGGRHIFFTVTQIHVVQMLRTSVPVLNMSKMAFADRPKVWELNGYPWPSISYKRAEEMNGHRHHNCYHKNVEEGYPCVVYIPDIAIDSPHVHVDLTISTQSCVSNGFADAGGHVSLPRVRL